MSDVSSSYSWISWFVAQPGNRFLLEIDDDYIRDNFNLYGLRPLFHFYDQALEMILDPECPDEEDFNDSDYNDIFSEASELYGLIHSRFALSPRGSQLLKEKYLQREFGQCPRVLCEGQNCLPIGLNDRMGKSTVRIYCPRCEQSYTPARPVNLDSAYFTPSLPHMLLQMYPDLVPLDRPTPFNPKIFGYKVHNQNSVIQIKLDNEAAGVRLPRRESDLGLDESDGESS